MNLSTFAVGLAFGLLLPGTGFAQAGECATVPPAGYVPRHIAEPERFQDFERRFARERAQRAAGDALATEDIPVSVVIIRSSAGSGGLSTTDLATAFQQANAPFAQIGLQFVPCGITYLDDDAFSNVTFGAKEAELVARVYDPSKLNIYFAPQVNNNNSCGYATFPGTYLNGGIDRPKLIIMNNACATNGSTLAHELGHTYGLLHTHETFLGSELVDGSNCDAAGDFVCDTPADPNVSNSVTAACLYTGTARDANNELYTPDPRNLMSYSRKACRDLFSVEQQSIIRFNADNSYDRQFCACPQTNPACAHFTVDKHFAFDCNGFAEFRLEARPGHDRYEWDFDGDNTVDATGRVVTFAPPAPGQFAPRLVVEIGAPSAITAGHALELPDHYALTLMAGITAPYVQDLESGSEPWAITQAPSGLTWLPNAGATPSSATGPKGGYSASGASIGTYLYLETSGTHPAGASASVTTQCVSVSASGFEEELSFYYHMFGSGIGELHVDAVGPTGVVTEDIMPALVGQQQASVSDAWRLATVPLKQFAGQSIELRFRATYGTTFTGDIAIDQIEITPVLNAPLPVELLAFTAEVAGPSNRLAWSSGSEFNVERYVLERATDGAPDFATIGERAASNERTGAEYLYVDASPLDGVQYYRLRMVDRDGSEAFSEVVSVTRGAPSGKTLTLHPNPASGEVFVAGLRQNDRVVLRNALGQVFRAEPRNGRLGLAGHAPGYYTVEVLREGGAVEALRLLVQ